MKLLTHCFKNTELGDVVAFSVLAGLNAYSVFEPWSRPASLCCVCGHDKQLLSPQRCINGYRPIYCWGLPCDGLESIHGGVEILLVASYCRSGNEEQACLATGLQKAFQDTCLSPARCITGYRRIVRTTENMLGVALRWTIIPLKGGGVLILLVVPC